MLYLPYTCLKNKVVYRNCYVLYHKPSQQHSHYPVRVLPTKERHSAQTQDLTRNPHKQREQQKQNPENTTTFLEHVERKAVSSTKITVKEGLITMLYVVNPLYSCDSLIHILTNSEYPDEMPHNTVFFSAYTVC